MWDDSVAKKIISLIFPGAGINRRTAYQAMAPFTTYDAQNVRLRSNPERRERGGQRPGLTKALYTQLGSGTPIRLLAPLSVTKSDGFSTFVEDFAGATLSTSWTAASWLAGSPNVFQGTTAASTATVGAVGSVLAAQSINASAVYDVEIFIVPFAGAHHGDYSLFLRMDDTTPVATTAGAVANLVLSSTGAYSGTLTVYVASVATVYTFSTGNLGATGGWFRVHITGNTATVFWQGVLILTQAIAAPAGKRIGFGLNCTDVTTNPTAYCLVSSFRAQFFNADLRPSRRTLLLASAGGTLYKTSPYGQIAAVGGSLTLGSDRTLMAAERSQCLYIADTGVPIVTGTDGVRGTADNRFDAASVADWTAVSGINNNDFYLEISSATGVLINGTYKFTVAAGELTTDHNCATGAGASTGTFRVLRSPKVYTDSTGALTQLMSSTPTASDTPPAGCSMVVLYRDRLVWAGDPNNPQVWYMSKAGDPLNYDYSAAATVVTRAVAGTSSTDAGILGEPITALIVGTADYLIITGPSSIQIMRGDPAYGGKFDTISNAVGIIGPQAWCHGPQGEVYFLSRDGLYSLESPESWAGRAQADANPKSVSRETIPMELLDIDPTQYQISMSYDMRDRGVHIYMRAAGYKTLKHWLYDIQTKGWWNMVLQSTHEPSCTLYFKADSAEDSALLLGCQDGYIRRYNELLENDDNSTITSFVLIGPIKLGADGFSMGLVQRLLAKLAKGAGPVAWSVFVGNTEEQAINNAVNSTALASGTWSKDGLQYASYPRARGAAMVLKLANSGARNWALESVEAAIVPAGVNRLA